MFKPHTKKLLYLSQLAVSTLLAALAATAQADQNIGTPTISDPGIQQKSAQLQQKATQTVQNMQTLSVTSPLVNDAAKTPVAVQFSPYPVTTTQMTLSQAGNGADTMTVPSLNQAIFFVGSDNYSAQWLQQHLAQLQSLHATGILVQAQTADEAKSILQIASNLPIVPLSGDSFAKQWGINRYPLLVLPPHAQ